MSILELAVAAFTGVRAQQGARDRQLGGLCVLVFSLGVGHGGLYRGKMGKIGLRGGVPHVGRHLTCANLLEPLRAGGVPRPRVQRRRRRVVSHAGGWMRVEHSNYCIVQSAHVWKLPLGFLPDPPSFHVSFIFLSFMLGGHHLEHRLPQVHGLVPRGSAVSGRAPLVASTAPPQLAPRPGLGQSLLHGTQGNMSLRSFSVISCKCYKSIHPHFFHVFVLNSYGTFTMFHLSFYVFVVYLNEGGVRRAALDRSPSATGGVLERDRAGRPRLEQRPEREGGHPRQGRHHHFRSAGRRDAGLKRKHGDPREAAIVNLCF